MPVLTVGPELQSAVLGRKSQTSSGQQVLGGSDGVPTKPDSSWTKWSNSNTSTGSCSSHRLPADGNISHGPFSIGCRVPSDGKVSEPGVWLVGEFPQGLGLSLGVHPIVNTGGVHGARSGICIARVDGSESPVKEAKMTGSVGPGRSRSFTWRGISGEDSGLGSAYASSMYPLIVAVVSSTKSTTGRKSASTGSL